MSQLTINRPLRLPGRAEAHMRRFSLAVAGLAVVYALIALVLRAPGPSLNPWGWLSRGTSTALLLAGAGLGALSLGRKRAGRALGALCFVWSVALFVLRAMTTPGPAAWRFSPTMVLMAVVAAAIASSPRRRSLAATAATVAGVGGLVAVIEDLLSVPWLPLGPHSHMVNPAVGLSLLLVSAGWLTLSPGHRPVSFLYEYTSTAWMMRRAVPLLFAFPFLVAWMRVEQQLGHRFGSWFSAFLLLAFCFFAFITLIWKAVGALDGLDRSREDVRTYANEISDLYNHAPCGYFSLDREGRFVRVNDTALAWLGFRREDFAGSVRIGDLLSDEGAASFAQQWPRLQACGAAVELELELRRKDGTWLAALITSSALCDPEGKFLRTRSTLVDVTQRRSLENQIRQAQKMEAIGSLAAGIAHDFNNLLTVINGYSDMLLERPLAPNDHAMLANVRKAGQRAAELTHQLLAFSRQQILQPRVLRLNAAVDEIEPLLRRTLGEHIQLTTDLTPDLHEVQADPGQIDQVVMNLVVNARDAMPDGGTITIATRNCDVDANFAAAHPGLAPGPHVCLSVSDTGTGMKPETQARIFDPFFTTKPLGQGTGLGLSTVFGIMRQSGGAISVDSSWGQGSRLSAFLPAYTSRQTPRPAPARPPRGSAAPTRGKGETILVVEDEEGPRRLVLDVLRAQGYNVLEAHHPEAALHLSEEYAGDIQLLVTDIVMPAMNGCLLASKLADQRPDLRVLLISGYADEVTSSFPFLQKPFAPHELARTVHSLLE